MDRARTRDPGPDRGLADPEPDADLDPPARGSTVLDPTAPDPRDHLARGTTDRGATGRRHLRSGAIASLARPGDGGRSSGVRRGRGRSGRPVIDLGRKGRVKTARGRTGLATIARGRTGGHLATIAPGTTGHATTGHATTGNLATTARGATVHPVRARHSIGGPVATPDAARFALPGRLRCRRPRSSGLMRS
jgi:hypothetical protein